MFQKIMDNFIFPMIVIFIVLFFLVSVVMGVISYHVYDQQKATIICHDSENFEVFNVENAHHITQNDGYTTFYLGNMKFGTSHPCKISYNKIGK